MKRCALKHHEENKDMLYAVRLMVVGLPLGMTAIPRKPPCGAFIRKKKVLSDKEKAE